MERLSCAASDASTWAEAQWHPRRCLVKGDSSDYGDQGIYGDLFTNTGRRSGRLVGADKHGCGKANSRQLLEVDVNYGPVPRPSIFQPSGVFVRPAKRTSLPVGELNAASRQVISSSTRAVKSVRPVKSVTTGARGLGPAGMIWEDQANLAGHGAASATGPREKEEPP